MRPTRFSVVFHVLVILAIAGMLFGCKPPQGKAIKENMVQVKPNHTAFMIPLEGQTKQQTKLMSVEYWENNLVATKRVEVPVRWLHTGRPWQNWAGEWLPTHRVITVDRAMVSREWCDDPAQGTTARSESIGVESVESIGIYLDIVINALIKEEDAATYLYWYGEKPLSEVVDENVRNEATSLLALGFGNKPLDECRKSKGDIVTDVGKKIAIGFASKGITITTFGLQGGLQYEDPAIQQSINEQFKSENAIIIKVNNEKAQVIENRRLFSIAENERKMAEERAKALEAYELQRQLDIFEVAVNKWSGNVPQWFNLSGDGGNSGLGFLISPELKPQQ